MIAFLLAIFIVYGGVHGYFLLKLRALFRLESAATLVLALFMAIMVVAPVLIRILEREGLKEWAQFFAFLGYTWMGFIFVAFSLLILGDLFFAVLRIAGLAGAKSAGRLPFFITAPVLAAAALICLYGYFEAKDIRTTAFTVEAPGLSPHLGTIRIVQISDVHLGIMVRRERLAMILDEVKAASPDILVSTGDLVDGEMDDLHELSSLLRDIEPRYGKFAVTGNHEFYAGIDQASEFIAEAGFRLLRNETVTVAESIAVAGVDDPAAKRFGPDDNLPERELLAPFKNNFFTILLKHQPKVEHESPPPFDLQLSGHTHKGQIAPFNLITALFYPFLAGRYDLEGGGLLYVSRGSGTWGPPIRVLSPPEVVIIDLIPGRKETAAR